VALPPTVEKLMQEQKEKDTDFTKSEEAKTKEIEEKVK
jgi:hypothetical protein